MPTVATSLVVLRWLCDSPWTGCAWRTTPYIYVARTSNNRVIMACELLLLAATVQSIAHMPLGISDHNIMVLWPGCEGCAEFNVHTKNVQSVRFVVKKEGMLLQPLWWCCVDCVIHHERDVCEEQHHAYMWREQVIIEWSWHVNCIVACYHRTKLCAYAARDFRSQHHHNLWRLCLNVCYVLDLTFVLLYYCFILCYVVICYLCGLYFQPFKK